MGKTFSDKTAAETLEPVIINPKTVNKVPKGIGNFNNLKK